MICCVRSAMRADSSVGSARASSRELVCRDCAPPSTAAKACSAVRTMFTSGCCAVSSQKAVQKAIGCGWAPVNSEARTEVVQRRLGDGTRQALVAREDPAGWGTRILFGLHSPVDGIETVLFLVVRLDDVPAHACIDGQIGPNAVGVLRENSSVVGHGEKRGIALLVHRCHSSQQIVRKTIASLSSVKCEGPIR